MHHMMMGNTPHAQYAITLSAKSVNLFLITDRWYRKRYKIIFSSDEKKRRKLGGRSRDALRGLCYPHRLHEECLLFHIERGR